MTKPTCSHLDCENQPFARGVCRKHYQQAYRNNTLPARLKTVYTNSLCYVSGCENPTQTQGLCPKHYKRKRLHNDPAYVQPKEIRICSVDPCENVAKAKGLCTNHYVADWHSKQTTKCSVDTCHYPVRAKSYCQKHYGAWLRHGNPLTRIRPERID